MNKKFLLLTLLVFSQFTFGVMQLELDQLNAQAKNGETLAMFKLSIYHLDGEEFEKAAKWMSRSAAKAEMDRGDEGRAIFLFRDMQKVINSRPKRKEKERKLLKKLGDKKDEYKQEAQDWIARKGLSADTSAFEEFYSEICKNEI